MNNLLYVIAVILIIGWIFRLFCLQRRRSDPRPPGDRAYRNRIKIDSRG
jgi:hypothetical protein